jgi:retron-type reverse transcriptase
MGFGIPFLEGFHFKGFSYGFRPGRSQHDALDALWIGIMRKKVSWVLDASVRDFFGSISDDWMVKFLQHRITDRRLVNREGPKLGPFWAPRAA